MARKEIQGQISLFDLLVEHQKNIEKMQEVQNKLDEAYKELFPDKDEDYYIELLGCLESNGDLIKGVKDCASLEEMELIKDAEKLSQAVKKDPDLLKAIVKRLDTQELMAFKSPSKASSYSKIEQGYIHSTPISGMVVAHKNKGETDLRLSPTLTMFIDMLVSEFTEAIPAKASVERIEQCRHIKLSVSKYCALKGLNGANSEKKARQDLKEIIMDLINRQLIIEEYPGTPGRLVQIIDSCKVEKAKNGAITPKCIKGAFDISLGMDFATLTANGNLHSYPTALYKVDTKRHPHSYDIGGRLINQYNMDGWEKGKGIKVESLLKWLTQMPTKEDIKKEGRHYNRLIREPFERDLLHLKDIGVIKDYKYYYKNKLVANIPEEDLAKEDFNTWQQYLLKITFTEDVLKEIKEQKKRKKEEPTLPA